MQSPRDPPVLTFLSLPEDIQLHIMRKVDFATRRTCIPLVCRAWRALAQPPSNLWSDTLDVEFPARPATATSPREFYITLAESVTAWLQRVHAAPTAVSVTHATGRPDREGAALLLLLRCLNWNVTRLSLQQFSAATVGTVLRVIGKQQRLIGLEHVSVGVLDMRHEHRLTEALVDYSKETLRALELDVCGIIDNHELLSGLSSLQQLTSLRISHGGGAGRVYGIDDSTAQRVLDQGIVTADVSPWLRCLTKLQELSFEGVPLPCVAFIQMMPQLMHVRVVDSGTMCWDDEDATSESHRCYLLDHQPLRSLDLSNSLITCVPDTVSRLTALTSLYMQNSQLQDDDMVLFGGCGGMTDGDVFQVPRFPMGLCNTPLRVLDVSYVGQVHGLSEQVLRVISGCRQLQRLIMRGCRVAWLPEWFGQRLRQLQVLDLSDTKELEVLPVKALRAMESLQELVVRGCVCLEETVADDTAGLQVMVVR